MKNNRNKIPSAIRLLKCNKTLYIKYNRIYK